MTANQKCGFLPCRGGPYDGKDLMAGDDVPEEWRITISVPTDKPAPDGFTRMELAKGVYVRKGEFLEWSEGIQ